MAKRYIADSFEVSGGVGANVLLDDGTTVALPISFDTTSSTRLANTSGTNTGNQNLQQVTDIGNITTNSIIVTGDTEQIQIRSSAVGGGYGALRIDWVTTLPFLWLSVEGSEYGASVKIDNISENWVYQFPDKAGTFALTSDLSNYLLNTTDTLTGDLTVTGTISGSIQSATANISGLTTLNGPVKRNVVTITPVTGTHSIDPNTTDYFLLNAIAGANTIEMINLTTANVGQSGIITIQNPATGTISFAPLPSYMKTPSGASINFVLTNNAISLISYFILSPTSVLCNYIGDFS
jgi:hypothetical protein